MAATVWDDATRAVAAHRLHHHISDHTPGLDPTSEGWADLAVQLARSRTWLASHDTQPAVPLARTRSLPELHHRLDELHAILATAPADHRHLVDALTTGQQHLDGLAPALEDALTAQGDRHDWILKHWPHVVEHAEITRTLTTGTPGPNIAPVLDHLAALDDLEPAHRMLAEAARTDQPWLRNLAGHLVQADTVEVGDVALDLLVRTAAHRQRWRITHPDPLGPPATSIAEATEKAALRAALGNTLMPQVPQRSGAGVGL